MRGQIDLRHRKHNDKVYWGYTKGGGGAGKGEKMGGRWRRSKKKLGGEAEKGEDHWKGIGIRGEKKRSKK